ncbi:MAG: hypothetical protein JWN50_394 [Parcubacteria group bacterium]|nr:hypothetical protein [Parcubacteria group bacterium]
MAKATIKTGSSTITVEGTEAEVARMIAMFGNLPASKPRARSIAAREHKDEKKRLSATDLLIALKEEGYFQKPHTLSDIAHKLEEDGFLIPTTTLSGVVLGLVQKKQLRRKRAEGKKWVYGQ